jgi:molybdenum cofactor biosynthesis enzyme MoaA
MEENMHIKFDELQELEKHRRDENDEILETQPISEKVDEENLIPITTQSQSPPRSWRLVDYYPHNQIIKSPNDKD